MPIADVKGNDPVRLDMLHVDLETLPSEQVYGDRVTAEGIDRKNVELLMYAAGKLTLHHDAGIAQIDVDVRATLPRVFPEGEIPARQFDDERINLVKPQVVAISGVTGQGSRAQTDDTESNRLLTGQILRMVLDSYSNPALPGVVRSGQSSLRFFLELKAMDRRSV
jgi:hypothetical protein